MVIRVRAVVRARSVEELVKVWLPGTCVSPTVRRGGASERAKGRIRWQSRALLQQQVRVSIVRGVVGGMYEHVRPCFADRTAPIVPVGVSRSSSFVLFDKMRDTRVTSRFKAREDILAREQDPLKTLTAPSDGDSDSPSRLYTFADSSRVCRRSPLLGAFVRRVHVYACCVTRSPLVVPFLLYKEHASRECATTILTDVARREI